VRWPLAGGTGADGQAVSYGVRPEHLTLAPAGNGVPGDVIVVEPTGAETELVIRVGAAQVILRMHGRARVEHDEKVGLAVDPANVHIFDQATGQRLAAYPALPRPSACCSYWDATARVSELRAALPRSIMELRTLERSFIMLRTDSAHNTTSPSPCATPVIFARSGRRSS
jgi:hypothetical protein